MPKKTLNECAEPTKQKSQISKDPPSVTCSNKVQFDSCEGIQNLFNAPDAPFQGIDADILNQKEGLGSSVFCNPMTTGDIVDDDSQVLPPDRSVIYRYG